jgi:hypothetical protein
MDTGEQGRGLRRERMRQRFDIRTSCARFLDLTRRLGHGRNPAESAGEMRGAVPQTPA